MTCIPRDVVAVMQVKAEITLRLKVHITVVYRNSCLVRMIANLTYCKKEYIYIYIPTLIPTFRVCPCIT